MKSTELAQVVAAAAVAACAGAAYVLIHEHRRKAKAERRAAAASSADSAASCCLGRDRLISILEESAIAAYQLIEQVSRPLPADHPPAEQGRCSHCGRTPMESPAT